MAPGGGSKDNQCLACGKQCTSQQFSVQCTLCSLWCHKDCGGISEAYFKALDLQMREMGTAFWACRSCMSFATKVNNQFRDMDRRIGEVSTKTEAVTKRVEEHTAEIGEVRGDVRKMEEKLEEMEKRLEDRMCAEIREREIRRLNLVLHRVDEPNQRIRDGRERMEADKKTCVKIFKAMKATVTCESIKF
jgi:DNA repair ATPase RecN